MIQQCFSIYVYHTVQLIILNIISEIISIINIKRRFMWQGTENWLRNTQHFKNSDTLKLLMETEAKQISA